MEENYIDLYNYLNNINKLDANVYSKLLTVYDEKVVNKVIEQLIDENSNNLSKFDYYISKVIRYEDDVVSTSIFESYGMDLSEFPTFSKEENDSLTNEIFMIVQKLNQLIYEVCEWNVDLCKIFWLSDRVEKSIELCKDIDKVNEIKRLYNMFLLKRNTLVSGNLRLVISIAKRFHINESIFNESIQYGNMGLMRAVEKYDPAFNTSFATYSYYWIKQCITRNIHNVMYPFIIPMNQVSLYYKYKKVKNGLEKELYREPTVPEIAEGMNISIPSLEMIINRFNDSLSLYDQVKNGEDNDSGMYIDFVEDENASVSDIMFNKDMIDEVQKAFGYLTDKERMVLEYRFGFVDGNVRTLNEVGEEFGVTRERIRQIEAKAIRKLSLKCKSLKDYYN